MIATRPTIHTTGGRGAALAPSSPRTIEEAPDSAGVYLLAFYRAGEHSTYPALRDSQHTGAMHYAGYADNIRARIADHRAGRGARLCRAVMLAGYEMRLVRVWRGRGRDYERTLKERHNLGAFCPVCRYHLAASASTEGQREELALWAQEIDA